MSDIFCRKKKHESFNHYIKSADRNFFTIILSCTLTESTMQRIRVKAVTFLSKYFVMRSGPGKFTTNSYAQEGEDIVLQKMIGDKRNGFYVEIGAHHPFRYSNTYLFYRKGWKGICIDPLPGIARKFALWRKRDIFLEIGIAGRKDTLYYHQFKEPAYNTFDASLAKERVDKAISEEIAVKPVPVLPLCEVLDTYLPESQAIDFFSVDVEGLDLEVLQSNNWQKYRPAYIIAESLTTCFSAVGDDEVAVFLHSIGYVPYAKTGNSVVYMDAGISI